MVSVQSLGSHPILGALLFPLISCMWPHAPWPQLHTLPDPYEGWSLDLEWQTLITFYFPPIFTVLDLQKSWKRSTMNSHMPFVLTSQLLTLCPIWSISDPSVYFSYHPPLFSEPVESTLCYPSLPCLNTSAWEQGYSTAYHCSLSHSNHFPWSSHTAQYPFYLAGFVLNQDSVNYHALYLVVNSLVSFDLTQLPAFTSHS